MSGVAFLELAVVLAFFASLGVLELVIKRLEKRRDSERRTHSRAGAEPRR